MVELIDRRTIEIHGLDTKYRAAIKKKLSLDNPIYIKKIQLKTPMWGTPRYIEYYKEEKDILHVPVGFLEPLKNFLERHKIQYSHRKQKTKKLKKEQIISTIRLRDYQEPLLEAMQKNDRGIIHLSTGGGKSIIALQYAANSQLTTTIIVKDKNLLHQFKSECEKYLGYTPGIIGDGTKEMKDITIATIQTLTSDESLRLELASRTTTLIIDECHLFLTEKRREVLSAFSPLNMYGLTATPFTSEESRQTPAIAFCFGDIIGEYLIEQMKPLVRVYPTGASIPVLPNYHDMIEKMIEHEQRNKLILGIALGEMLSGAKVLILTKRVAHAELLAEKLKHLGGVYLVKADTPDKASILKEMKDGSRPFSGIIGTMQLLGTGFDVPTLDRLLIVGDMKSNVLTVQTTGRILRLLDEKEPIIYDFVDEKNGMLKSQFRSRKKIYKDKGWATEYHPEYMERRL